MPLRTWLAFLAFVAIWSLACNGLLELAPKHPILIFILWLVVFLGGTGYIATGRKGDGVALLAFTVGPILILAAIGSALLLIMHWIS
jgi:hypothetical protein